MAYNKLRRDIAKYLSTPVEPGVYSPTPGDALLARAYAALGGAVGDNRPEVIADPAQPTTTVRFVDAEGEQVGRIVELQEPVPVQDADTYIVGDPGDEIAPHGMGAVAE
jgi:hypothetical protein